MSSPSPRNPLFIGLGALALLVVAANTISVVSETDQAIISSYGKVERIVNAYHPNERFGKTGAGLTFRIPFVEQIQLIDKRVLGVSMEQQEVPTTDQLRLQVDAFARFRVTKPARMFRTIGSEDKLVDQLRALLGSSLRNELGKRKFDDLITAERGRVMDNIQFTLNRDAAKYGAEVIDVRINRADLPKATLQSAFNRMKSERNQEAIAIDAEGQKEAQIIRATAEADAARIYAISYGKDAEFYDFYRAMQSYRQTFLSPDSNTNMILSPNSDYLRKFQNGR